MAMVDDHERRISTLEGERPSIVQGIADIKAVVLADMTARNDQHTKTSAMLAVIVEQNNASTSYQKTCDEERRSLDKRVSVLEGFQSRLMRNAIAVSTIAGFVINQGVEWFKK